MADSLDILQAFYKAQTIKDPVALATYVTQRYGSMDKFAMARGMVGKKDAKNWNPVKNTAGSKKGKSANAPKGGPSQRTLTAGKGKDRTTYGKRSKAERGIGKPGRPKTAEPKQRTSYGGRTGGGTRSKEGGYGTRASWTGKGSKGRGKGYGRTAAGKSMDFDKAQAIEDSRELAAHLSGRSKGSSGQLWHGGSAPRQAWHVYEGGLRGKARAKEWNPIGGPPGSVYDKTGKREHPDKKKKPQARLGGKFASRGKTGKEEPHYQSRMKLSLEKSFEVLLKAKFGGKPLGWEELPRDPIAFATNVMNHKGYWYSNIKAGTRGAKMRNKLSQGIRQLVNNIPDASVKEKKQGKIKDDKDRDEAKKMAEEMENSWKKGERPDVKVEKQAFPSALAGLAAFGAGWAMSDTFTEAPRGQMTPSQQREWERLVRSAMRRKRTLRKDGIEALQSYYKDSSDTYTKRLPIANSLNLTKEHAPVPPRQGLVFDALKHRWTSQEKVGKTVAEVQGKKRIRGTGTGQHEHSKAGGGAKGLGMSAEAGRRFRSAADAGVIKPHESQHPSTAHQKITKKKLLQHLRGRAGTGRTLH